MSAQERIEKAQALKKSILAIVREFGDSDIEAVAALLYARIVILEESFVEDPDGGRGVCSDTALRAYNDAQLNFDRVFENYGFGGK
jgi:hypothetical protein